MKFVAVVFALAVLSGCHGDVLPQDEDKSSGETFIDQVKGYITDLNSKVDDTIQNIRSSTLGRELDTFIADVTDELNTKLGPFVQDTAEKVSTDLELLGNKLNVHVTELWDKSVQYAEEFRTIVQQNADEVTSRVTAYTNKLNKRLTKDTEEMLKKLTTYLEEVYSRTALRMESVQETLNQARKRTEKKFAALNQLLTSYVDDVQANLQTHTGNIGEKISSTAENLRTTFGDKMVVLRNWYQPYVTMVQEKLEN